MQITTVAAAFTWILFVILRYLRVNGLIKAGICSVLCGIFIAFINDIISWILDQTARINLADANLMKWNTEVLVNANTYLLILLAGCTAGVILILAGIFHRSRKK